MNSVPLPVTGPELTVSGESAAIYSNRFFVTIGPPVVRIGFAEQWGPESALHSRTAVALTIQDAIELAKTLTDLLKPFEESVEQPAKSANG